MHHKRLMMREKSAPHFQRSAFTFPGASRPGLCNPTWTVAPRRAACRGESLLLNRDKFGIAGADYALATGESVYVTVPKLFGVLIDQRAKQPYSGHNQFHRSDAQAYAGAGAAEPRSVLRNNPA
jgi:hypothetical protein